MGQYKSYREENLDKKIVQLEQDLIQLKTIQSYTLAQMSMGYESNAVSVQAYQMPYWNNEYGILAVFSFVSQYSNIVPFGYIKWFSSMGDEYGVLIQQKTRVLNQNSIEIILLFKDTLIPMSSPNQFTASISFLSNTKGVLKLENTYVIPRN